MQEVRSSSPRLAKDFFYIKILGWVGCLCNVHMLLISWCTVGVSFSTFGQEYNKQIHHRVWHSCEINVLHKDFCCFQSYLLCLHRPGPSLGIYNFWVRSYYNMWDLYRELITCVSLTLNLSDFFRHFRHFWIHFNPFQVFLDPLISGSISSYFNTFQCISIHFTKYK